MFSSSTTLSFQMRIFTMGTTRLTQIVKRFEIQLFMATKKVKTTIVTGFLFMFLKARSKALQIFFAIVIK